MNKAEFYDSVRSEFGRLSQSQVDGFEHILEASDGMRRSHVAYLLATAWHETGAMMQPIKETVSPSHRDKNPSDETVVGRLDRAWASGKMPSVRTPYWRFDLQGKAWFGRGYVQLTHRKNYEKAAALVGADLLGNPNLAMRPDIAAKVLVEGSEIGMFTGKKLNDYLPGDYRNARRVINGTDKADLIARYAQQFEVALQRAGVSDLVESEVVPKPALEPAPEPAKESALSALIRAIMAALFKRRG